MWARSAEAAIRGHDQAYNMANWPKETREKAYRLVAQDMSELYEDLEAGVDAYKQTRENDPFLGAE